MLKQKKNIVKKCANFKNNSKTSTNIKYNILSPTMQEIDCIFPTVPSSLCKHPLLPFADMQVCSSEQHLPLNVSSQTVTAKTEEELMEPRIDHHTSIQLELQTALLMCEPLTALK